MVKKIVIFVTVFLAFDRFIQHKIFAGRQQQLLAMRAYEHNNKTLHEKNGLKSPSLA